MLSFVDPAGISNPTFHPCVRYSKWAASRVLSFVPPDGRSTLMTFHVGPLPGDLQAAKSGVRRKPLGTALGGGLTPIALKPTVTVGRAGGSFTFTLGSLLPASVAFTHVEMSWRLGPVDGVTASVTGGKLNFAPGQGGADKQRESGGGDWSWDADAGVLRWRLERLSAMERESRLSGTWRSACGHFRRGCAGTNTHPLACRGSWTRPAPAVAVAFEVQSFSLTGIRVDRLKLAGGESTGATMFKGVRSQVRSGKVEVRW